MPDTIEIAPPADLESTRHTAGTRWFPQVFSAATTGGLAILGQGTFAGAHFLMNVLLARWLPPEQYGAFALAYSGFLLFLMLYGACIYEPLIVFGSGRYAGRFQEYFWLLARGNVAVLAAFSSSIFSRCSPRLSCSAWTAGSRGAPPFWVWDWRG